jgi:hypothetical protein
VEKLKKEEYDDAHARWEIKKRSATQTQDAKTSIFLLNVCVGVELLRSNF